MEYNFLKVDFILQGNIYLIYGIVAYDCFNNFFLGEYNHFINYIFNFETDVTFYVNDLDKLYIYIAKTLFDKGFKCVADKLENKTFKYSCTSGECSNLRIKTNRGNEIIFVNFNKKFGVDFGTQEQNIELLNYALEKGRTRLSLGADAYNEFIRTQLPASRYNDYVANQIIRNDEHFPILETIPELEEAKLLIAGYQCCTKGTFENVIEYDIRSSYASQLLKSMPVGKPKYYDNLEEVPKSYFKIIKFTYFNCVPIPNKIHFVDTNAIGSLALPECMFELFKENYNCKIKISKIIAFKTRMHMFDQFVTDNIINGKVNEKREYIAKYNKYIGNSIVGYLGRKTTQENNILVMNYKNIENNKENKRVDPIYLPAYICVLDRAKSAFVRTIQRHRNSIIYANTDGFYSTKQLDTRLLNAGNGKPIGIYRCKSKMAVLNIEGINNLTGIKDTGEVTNVLSGMRMLDTITPEQHHSKTYEYYIDVPSAKGYMMRQIISPRHAQ